MSLEKFIRKLFCVQSKELLRAIFLMFLLSLAGLVCALLAAIE
jgi:hypothetical protein